MNPLFNNWLKKNKGIAFEELDKKTEEEKMEMWKEYCKHREYQKAVLRLR